MNGASVEFTRDGFVITYPLVLWEEWGFNSPKHPENVIDKMVVDLKIDKYFKNTGSGAGDRVREVFFERK